MEVISSIATFKFSNKLTRINTDEFISSVGSDHLGSGADFTSNHEEETKRA
jgi:hypothetical protein